MRGNHRFLLFASVLVAAFCLFFVADTVGLILDEGEDPDRPPGVAGPFDEADYLQRRDAFIALLRGNDPNKPPDPTARNRALALMDNQVKALRAGKSANQLLAFPNWVELGPNPIPLGQTQTTRVPVSGRISAIEIDPSDPNKVYVGTAQGGVYRSLDGGATWTPIFDNALTLSIGTLTLDAANNRLWVGTGEANGSADSFAGVGLYRIENVNTTADLIGPINPIRNYLNGSGNPVSTGFFTGRSVSKIVRVPNDPNTLFVGVAGGVIGIGGNPPFGNSVPPLAMRGLVRLANVNGPVAGITGTRLGVSTTDTGQGLCAFDTPCTVNRNVNDLILDPQDPTGNTLLVWMNGINLAGDGGIYRSTNAMSGAPTFTQTLVTTSTSTSNGRGELRAYVRAGTTVVYVASGEPSTPNVAGGGTLCNSASNFGALRRSDNGGVTWSAKLPGGGGFCAGQCFYNIGFDVLPGAATTTDKLLLGGNVRSTNCAKQQATSLDGGATAFVNHDDTTHADTHVIKFAPSNQLVVYRGDDGGVWKSTNGGDTWAHQNNSTLRATQFQSIAVHPTDPDITIGGTQDNGTNKMVAGPVWSHSDDGDGGYAMIDQSTPTTMYHTYFNQTSSQIGLARSLNSGTSWSFLGCSGTGTTNGISCNPATTTAVNFYAPTALGPGSPNNTVYLGTDRLLRSSTQGTANVTVSQAPLVSGVPLSSIAISPQDDNYRIVGLNNGALFFTTTGSSTLTSLDPTGGGSVIPNFYVSRLAFDPTDKNTVYIALGNYAGGTAPTNSHVWKVTNLNTTPVLTAINGSGANILPDVPVSGFAVDPLMPSRLFAGTDIGIYVTYDGGGNWVPYGVGLPRVAVFDIAIQNVKRVLRIATHGRGMWEISLADCLMTCPSNITQTTDPSQCGAIVNYTAPTTTGSCGTVTCTPPPGSFFTLGTTTVTCNATGAPMPSCSFTVTVNCLPISFAPSLPNGVQGMAYSQSAVVGPTNGYTFAVTTNILPPGLSLNPATGTITGTPSAPGNYTFVITATVGGECCTQSRSYNLLITGTCAGITVNPATLPNGTLGTAYPAASVSATSGVAPYTFSVSQGALPAGLVLDANTGAITGTPTLAGSFSFRVTATGQGGCTGSRQYVVSVACATLTFSPASLPNGAKSVAYNQAITGTPGTGHTFSLSLGSLPPGYTLSAAGVLSGITNQTGTWTFTVKAVLGSCQATRQYTLTIPNTTAPTALAQLNDYDGDAKADLALFAASGEWRIQRSSDQQSQTVLWGTAGDLPVSGDYDGDGRTDVAIFRPGDGTWYIKRSSDGAALVKAWGLGTDVPVPGDYDGDGKTDIAVWRGAEGNWYILRSSDQQFEMANWGLSLVPFNDVPVAGDYDGDGKTDLGVFRRANGVWYVRQSGNGNLLLKALGLGTDLPVVNDYDGDGKVDLAVWRGATGLWYIQRSATGLTRATAWGAGFAPYNDQAVPGDYDGDGQADIAVWRAGNATWYVMQSNDGSMLTKTQGQSNDAPIVQRVR